ncbi:MAG TPA: glucosamine-6-phosphate deaminase [Clostridiales bacterium]|nr:glucosamine-6-phosphate deaminase [Clostridiales bacterium]
MRIILCDNYEELSKKAAKIVASQITLKPDSVLGLATGSTPVGMYNELAKMYRQGELDFSEVKTFNLDEYYPIKKKNKQSYDWFMRENLFSKINIKNENIHIPNGETDNPKKECEDYEKSIKANGGVDLQILGIGRNGHIGFNEPDASLNSFTHLTNLTENTIKANSRFFESSEDVPKQALTMGISTILNAKKIILLASGASKRKVVSELINGGINTNIPATMLKTHPDVVLVCDRESYSGAKLGIDIGGTNIKMAVIDQNDIVYKSSFKTEDTEEKIIQSLTEKIINLKNSLDITTVGIGTPGIIKEGKVTATNLPFKNTPLESEISEKTGLCVTVDNDANCAALGEVIFGSTKTCENIVLVTLGTGVGGGIIMNRQILHSNNNMGEIGHFVIQAENGRPCPCGQTGCWEQYCSMTAFIKDAKDAAKQNSDSILYKMIKNDKLSGEDIFKAMDKGCPVAKKVFDDYIRYLAMGINSLVNIFGPDAVVLAGGVTRQGDKLLNPLKKLIKTDVRLEISTLQNDAGALGASQL